jgi:septum formation protein
MLVLASQSVIRQELLKQAGIEYVLASHTADERAISWDQPLADLVLRIAEHKINHVVMPRTQILYPFSYILTADTLTQDKAGVLYGKPQDYADAISMIKALRVGSIVATAFVVEKREYKSNTWVTRERIKRVVTATCIVNVPDSCIDNYILHASALQAAGALVIDGYGAQFTQTITGSYTGILGLPLYELRQALEQLDFYSACNTKLS